MAVHKYPGSIISLLEHIRAKAAFSAWMRPALNLPFVKVGGNGTGTIDANAYIPENEPLHHRTSGLQPAKRFKKSKLSGNSLASVHHRKRVSYQGPEILGIEEQLAFAQLFQHLDHVNFCAYFLWGGGWRIQC